MVELAYAIIFSGIAVFIVCLFLAPLPKSPDDPPRLFERGDKFPPS